MIRTSICREKGAQIPVLKAKQTSRETSPIAASDPYATWARRLIRIPRPFTVGLAAPRQADAPPEPRGVAERRPGDDPATRLARGSALEPWVQP